jgi:hypothetical protein
MIQGLGNEGERDERRRREGRERVEMSDICRIFTK